MAVYLGHQFQAPDLGLEHPAAKKDRDTSEVETQGAHDDDA